MFPQMFPPNISRGKVWRKLLGCHDLVWGRGLYVTWLPRLKYQRVIGDVFLVTEPQVSSKVSPNVFAIEETFVESLELGRFPLSWQAYS